MDLLWVPDKKTAENPFRCAAYVMAPWCNRIKEAAFRFGKDNYRLRSNLDDGTAIHGDVYYRPWSVTKQAGRAEATLKTGVDFNFPFPLAFRQSLKVQRDRLFWTFSVKNLSNQPAPVGFGLHPFFLTKIGGSTGELNVPARRRYPSVCAIPTGNPVPVRSPIKNISQLDSCYTDLRGPVSMRFPKAGFEWEMKLGKGFGHVYLYRAPFRKDVLCIEPMTLAVNGFNLLANGKRGTGVRVLKPQASWSAGITLRVKPIYSSASSLSLT